MVAGHLEILRSVSVGVFVLIKSDRNHSNILSDICYFRLSSDLVLLTSILTIDKLIFPIFLFRKLPFFY